MQNRDSSTVHNNISNPNLLYSPLSVLEIKFCPLTRGMDHFQRILHKTRLAHDNGKPPGFWTLMGVFQGVFKWMFKGNLDVDL